MRELFIGEAVAGMALAYITHDMIAARAGTIITLSCDAGAQIYHHAAPALQSDSMTMDGLMR